MAACSKYLTNIFQFYCSCSEVSSRPFRLIPVDLFCPAEAAASRAVLVKKAAVEAEAGVASFLFQAVEGQASEAGRLVEEAEAWDSA